MCSVPRSIGTAASRQMGVLAQAGGEGEKGTPDLWAMGGGMRHVHTSTVSGGF